MSDLSPDQLAILEEVVDRPETLLGSTFGLDAQIFTKWIAFCESAGRSNSAVLNGKLFAFGFSAAAKTGSSLSSQDLISAANSLGTILTLGADCKLQASSSGQVTLSASLTRTEKNSGLEMLMHGTYCYLVFRGRILKEGDLFDQAKLPPAGISFYRPAAQMSLLIGDHATQEVMKEAGVKYWSNREKRVLLAKPESTEKIFQRALLNWLRRYTLHKIRIVSETRGFGQDATDITVITQSGDYVVEVKWLGRNENNTAFGLDRIQEGVHQVNIYLKGDSQLVSGTLVVYDGLSLAPMQNMPYDPAQVHERCERP